MCEKWLDFTERFWTVRKEIKEIAVNRLQKKDLSKVDLSKIKFKTVIFKTIFEILAEPNKTYTEKLQEWFEIQKQYKWLFDIKLDWWLWISEARKAPWYNKTIDEEKEEIAREILEMDLARAKWNYKVLHEITFL